MKMMEKAILLTLSLCCGLMGLFLAYGWPLTLLTCRYVETSQVDCQLQQRLFGLLPIETIPVTRLERAAVEWGAESRRDDANRETSVAVAYVRLVTASGEINLDSAAESWFTFGNAERIAGRLNDFLETPATEPLTVWQVVWPPFLLGGCFSLGFIGALLIIGDLILLRFRVFQDWRQRQSQVARFRRRLGLKDKDDG